MTSAHYRYDTTNERDFSSETFRIPQHNHSPAASPLTPADPQDYNSVQPLLIANQTLVHIGKPQPLHHPAAM